MRNGGHAEVNVSVSTEERHLGMILCRHCNALIDTLDTSGVKVFYSVCERTECKNAQADDPIR